MAVKTTFCVFVWRNWSNPETVSEHSYFFREESKNISWDILQPLQIVLENIVGLHEASDRSALDFAG